MNGDVEVEAPRPRPLSAGIWTLFSWLRRTDRSSSSESVSSVGSDRSVASFDFLAPLNYNHGNTPLVLPPNPLTETYKKRLQERSLQRQHDRDLTLRRKYGLFREEGLGYDAFSLPSARRLQKDTVLRQDRERRATSESIRRTAYVPGKRRAPLPPSVVVSATLPRNYKRKRPAPKPPVNLTEENKENISINKIVQMNTSAEIVNNTSISTELTLANKIEEQPKHETKEIKLRSDKSFLKQIFDSKKRNSAIDTSRIKLLPSISELDKQAAEIIEANKMLRASGRNSFTDNSSRPDSTEETWICTTCLRKYKPVVTCCIYCIIKENSNKNSKNVHINASNICTQTDQKDLKSNRSKGIDDKKKLREMLKEMKDSLPKRPKHNAKYPKDNDDTVKSTETPTLRIGSTIDENIKGNFNNINSNEKECRPSESKNTAKQTFFSSQPSSSKDFSIPFIGNNISEINRKSACKTSSPNISNANINVSTPDILVKSVKKSPDSNSNLVNNTHETYSPNINKQTANSLNDDRQGANGMHRAPDLRTINHNLSLVHTQDNKAKKASNIQTNAISVNQTFIEVQKKTQNKNIPPLVVNTDLKKQGHRTENHENIEQSNTKTPISNNKQLAELKKCDSPGSDTKDETKKAQLGNALSSKIEIKSAGQGDINSSNNNLNTPLKVSSLLNPLYCPKYKTPNDRVADCSFGNIVSTKEENIKKHEISQTQPTILPEKVVAPTFVNVQTPSTSITKVVNDVLQKSESQHTEASKNNKCENPPAIVEDNQKEQIAKNVLTDVKTDASSYVKVLDHHNRRRNLINQLEHAIAEGNEQLAAEAAANLAKLKIACSVLSFSSQIIAEPLSNKTAGIHNIKREENHYKLQVKLNSPSKIENFRDMPGTKQSEQQDKQKPVSANGAEVNILPEASASTSSQISDNQIPIELWVEDREAARGPIPLRISRKARMVELKRHVETSLGLDIRLQRWIVGRNLCTDDNTPLTALAGPDLNAPFYLCLVESETNKDNPQQIKDDKRTQIKAPNEINDPALGDVYTELMKLEQQALVPNTEPFECGVCIEQCDVGAGVVLRECIHTFCRECLVDVIRHCEEPVVPCPAIQCPGALQEREIRAILSAEEYERWLARGLAAAESGTRNTFHCRTRDCKGWAFCEPGVRRFPCPVCRHTNCVPCQAVHEGETCEHYQMKLREAVTAAESNQTDQGTRALLASLIARGEALECPECSAIITKKWGCDWVKCSACKTEICWVTKGRRWGPGGKGDTSGGCRCGVEGQRCHPSCGYCH